MQNSCWFYTFSSRRRRSHIAGRVRLQVALSCDFFIYLIFMSVKVLALLCLCLWLFFLVLPTQAIPHVIKKTLWYLRVCEELKTAGLYKSFRSLHLDFYIYNEGTTDWSCSIGREKYLTQTGNIMAYWANNTVKICFCVSTRIFHWRNFKTCRRKERFTRRITPR